MNAKQADHKTFVRMVNAIEASDPSVSGENRSRYSGLARWFCLADTQNARDAIGRKINGKVGVTRSDLGLINALMLLERVGFDLRSAIFDSGKIASIKRHGIEEKL